MRYLVEIKNSYGWMSLGSHTLLINAVISAKDIMSDYPDANVRIEVIPF